MIPVGQSIFLIGLIKRWFPEASSAVDSPLSSNYRILPLALEQRGTRASPIVPQHKSNHPRIRQ